MHFVLQERGNAIKALENRQKDSKREMDVLSALDELRSFNARKQKLSFEQVLSALKNSDREEPKQAVSGQKRTEPSDDLNSEDEDAIRTLFYQQRAKLQKTEEQDETDDVPTSPPEPSPAKTTPNLETKPKEPREASKRGPLLGSGLFKSRLKFKVRKKPDKNS